MNLIIDIGNTQFKVCVFEKSEIIYHQYITNISQDFINSLIKEYDITKAIYSDTRGLKNEDLIDKIPDNLKIIELTHKTPLPIKLDYLTPETLGKDRIAGAVAAALLYRGCACLVIDTGTAITIDFVSDKGVFKGGVISPGPETRFKSLHDNTGKLPLINPTESVEILGNSTEKAIQSGVQNGILYEINGYISRFNEQYPELKVILTGGYAFLFEKNINYPIFADSFLVPKGLNRILTYNE